MTTEQIQQKQRRESAKFETAVQIRKLLDDLKSGLGDETEADEYEAEILSLVTDDE